jgi:hypothetical protein
MNIYKYEAIEVFKEQVNSIEEEKVQPMDFYLV